MSEAEPTTTVSAKKTPVSQAAEQQARSDDKSIWDWLQEMGGTTGEMRIKIERRYPREWQGHHIAGYLEEFDEPFSEADIKQRFGGGKFMVKIQRRGANGGSWIFAGSKTFEIEGDPRLAGSLLTNTPTTTPVKPTPEDADVALQKQAMDHMARTSELNQKRAWALEDERRQGSRSDSDLMKLVVDPPALQAMRGEMTELRRAIASKDEQIFKLIADAGRPPATPSVIEKTFEHLVAGESGRIEALRTQFDSELRTLRENHRHDVDRERDRLKNELDSRERSHEREIASLRETHAQAMKSVEQSYEARIEGYKRHEHDLERQLTESRAETTKLRDQKEKGPLDLVEEVAKMKNALEVLSPEQEPTSTWERVLGSVMQSPIVQAAATRIENAPAVPPQPNPEQMRRRRAAAAARAAQGGPPSEQPGEAAVIPLRKRPASRPQVIELNPVEVAAAVQFMEQAVINGTDPRQFAESSRSMVPKDVMAALKAQGVDAFLSQTVQLADGSPLSTQVGRNWARKVARWLVEGATEEPVEPVVVEPPPVG